MQRDIELLATLFGHIARGISVQIQSDEQAVYLFCTRAGYALKRLLDLTAHNSSGREYIFATSRLMAAKVAFRYSPEAFIEVCVENYGKASLGEALAGLLPQEFLGQQLISQSCLESKIDIRQKCSHDALREALKPETTIGKLLREHLNEQYGYYQNYITSLAGNFEKIVLVDSGWRGTCQYLLQIAFPQWQFHGYYLGIDHPKSQLVSKRSYGILTTGGRFKNIMQHNHIFEHILEPKVMSTGYFVEKSGGWYVNGDINTLLLDQCVQHEKIYKPEFNIVCQLIPQGQSIAQQAIAVEAALQGIEQLILEPVYDILSSPILNTGNRTADFGKNDNSLSIITRPYTLRLRNVEDRINFSLWKEGQRILETGRLSSETQKHLSNEAYHQQDRLLTLNQAINEDCFDTRVNKKNDYSVNRFKSVAVITRTKNRPLLLKRAMQSVEQQTYQFLHWVVINDGGKPEAVNKVLEQCSLPLNKWTVIHNPISIGMEAASNEAIRAVSSDLIVIHDDDDAWEPDFLVEAISFLNECANKFPNVNAVVTHAWRVSEYLFENYAQSLEKIGYKDWFEYIEFKHLAQENLFAPIQFIFSREIYARIGGFNEQLPVLGDWDFNLRFLMEAEIIVLKKKLAYYYHRDYQKKGIYANSVFDSIDQHGFYGHWIRNNAIRKQFK